jgi:hypothetical protein
MAKRDQSTAKWHQKQFEKSNGNQFVSQRAQIRDSKERHKQLRETITDKVWFDSLTFDEKESVIFNWYFFYKDDGYWYSSDSEMIPKEGESREDYCKRRTPGCKHTQRDMKLNKILS